MQISTLATMPKQAPALPTTQFSSTSSGLLIAQAGEETLSPTQFTVKQALDVFSERLKGFLKTPPSEDKEFFSIMADAVPTMRHLRQLEKDLNQAPEEAPKVSMINTQG